MLNSMLGCVVIAVMGSCDGATHDMHDRHGRDPHPHRAMQYELQTRVHLVNAPRDGVACGPLVWVPGTKQPIALDHLDVLPTSSTAARHAARRNDGADMFGFSCACHRWHHVAPVCLLEERGRVSCAHTCRFLQNECAHCLHFAVQGRRCGSRCQNWSLESSRSAICLTLRRRGCDLRQRALLPGTFPLSTMSRAEVSFSHSLLFIVVRT